MLKQADINLKMIGKVQTNESMTQLATPNFDAVFGKTKQSNRVYYHFKDPKSKIDVRSKAYSLIYMPLIPRFKAKGGKGALEIDTQSPLFLPVLVNLEGDHPCDLNKQGAGSVYCAYKMAGGVPTVFQREIKGNSFPLPNYIDKSLPEYEGLFYFIPVVLCNASVCYCVTKNVNAVSKYLQDAKDMLAQNGDYFIAIDKEIVPIDDWRTLVCFFDIEAGELKDVRIVSEFKPLNP